MTSLYKQSVPTFVKYLRVLEGLLQKGEKFADDKGLKHDEILDARLAPDMKSFLYQTQALCNSTRMGFERMCGFEHVEVADDEKTFADLYKRIHDTIDWLEKEVSEEKLAGKEQAEFFMQTKMAGTYRFESHQAYLSEFVFPNFWFHMVIAYSVLRTKGVDVGALDFYKGILVKAE